LLDLNFAASHRLIDSGNRAHVESISPSNCSDLESLPAAHYFTTLLRQTENFPSARQNILSKCSLHLGSFFGAIYEYRRCAYETL